LFRPSSALPAAVLSLLVSTEPAYADLKLCKPHELRDRGCDRHRRTRRRPRRGAGFASIRDLPRRVQGTLAADRILLNARALGVYGASPLPQNGSDTLCVAPGNFVIAAARQCRNRADARVIHPDQPGAS